MRADRLVSVLLMLQQKKQVTVAQVAEELEVSERTVRRDLEALAMAGQPIYSERGRNGGWRLLGEGRTDLSGLKADEAYALFGLSGMSTTVTPELKQALKKLLSALPESFRDEAETAAASVHVDPAGWGGNGSGGAPRYLDALQAAAFCRQELMLGYLDRNGKETKRLICPFGVVLKGTTWYLVAGTDNGQRTFKVGRVKSVESTGNTFERPGDFDLGESWRQVVTAVDTLRGPESVEAIAEPWASEAIVWMFGSLAKPGDRFADGRVGITVSGQNRNVIVRRLLSFGRGAQIVGPPEALEVAKETAGELAELYCRPGKR